MVLPARPAAADGAAGSLAHRGRRVSAGVAGALMGGVVCASAILRRNLVDAVTRAERARVTSRAA